MSYDLFAFPKIDGETPSETAARLLSDPETCDENPADPAIEALSKDIVDALRQEFPDLQPFQLDYERIAEFDKISVEQARARYRYVELNGSDEAGMQITVHPDHTVITVPYWHKGDDARRVFAEIWHMVRTIQRTSGFVIFDSQHDRAISLDRDFNLVVESYRKVSDQLENIVAESHVQIEAQIGERRSRPWWKFW